MASMRTSVLIILLSLLMGSCDWAPDEYEIDAATYYKSLNLALGDTVDLEISGDDLSLDEISYSGILDVEVRDSSMIRIVGVGLGQSQVTIRSTVPASHDSENPETISSYIKVSVSDGIPVALFLGDQINIFLGDYLNPEQYIRLDSISVSFPDDSTRSELEMSISS